MESMQLNAQSRKASSKGHLKQLRAHGFVPGIVYGKKEAPVMAAVDSKDLVSILQSPAGTNTLVNLTLDGRTATVMIKELKRDIIRRDRFLHIDFIRISPEDKIEVGVPVVLSGEAAGVRNGGVLQQHLWEVLLKCLPANIPDNLELDISELGVGESLTVHDLEVPAGGEIMADADSVVVSVTAPPAADEAEPAAEETRDNSAAKETENE